MLHNFKINSIFAIGKKQKCFLKGRGYFTSSLKKEIEMNKKNYCLTNLNLLSKQRGTLKLLPYVFVVFIFLNTKYTKEFSQRHTKFNYEITHKSL